MKNTNMCRNSFLVFLEWMSREEGQNYPASIIKTTDEHSFDSKGL